MPYLFDLDGTLIDSEKAHKSAEVVTFGTFGLVVSEDDLFRFTGVPYRTMLAAVSAEHAVAVPLEEFMARHKKTLLDKVGSEIFPFPDVDGCLTRFLNTPMALVTSSPGWYVDAILSTFPIFGEKFQHRVCADDVTHGKPHPEAFQLASARLGFEPKACIAVEDSANGIASAKAAGCYTIAVRRDDRIDLTQADSVIATLDELAEVA
ncbi:MAG: HAD family phosphatase [Armatimonadota bacterium]|nr:HAD family phosphatase [Armatimonadota bacterium]